MHPIILTLGSWKIYSYGVALSLAIIVGVGVCWREARRVRLPGEQLLIFCAGAIAFGLAGARLNDWLFHLDIYRTLPGLGASPNGGLTSFGGIAGALAFGVMYAWRHHWRLWAFLDLLAPIIPLVESIMRWGCLLNGCCYGRETEGLGGFYLPDVDGRWANRYPTQVMLSILSLTLFAWLWQRRRNRPFDGAAILSYLVLYSMGRFAIDMLRGDQIAVWGPLTGYQLLSALIALMAGVALFYRARIHGALPAATSKQ